MRASARWFRALSCIKFGWFCPLGRGHFRAEDRCVRFNCPTCKRPCEGTFKEFPTLPFCSTRCRAADLGSWLDEAYRIGSPIAEEDLDAGLPTEGHASPSDDEN
jgi:endogenous inhibitor of DNA gyrase (YacG/DUF329 family)